MLPWVEVTVLMVRTQALGFPLKLSTALEWMMSVTVVTLGLLQPWFPTRPALITGFLMKGH